MQGNIGQLGKVSIHAPHEGERLDLSTYPVMQYGFNPRSPRGGATPRCHSYPTRGARRFNPRSPRGGATRAASIYRSLPHRFQSTLPTRGSDAQNGAVPKCTDVSIHAPHEGERRPPKSRPCVRYMFQSTLPTRGSDAIKHQKQASSDGFNPRSPRGGATITVVYPVFRGGVSIHAPHEGERPYRAGLSS